jgi:signal transduction histidine kinase
MLPYKILYKRIRILRVVLPLAVVVLVSLYVFGPARWIHSSLGLEYHLMAEMAVFGSLGPMFVFLVLDLIARWMEERETSELQARVLEEARLEAEHNRLLTDNALQAMFAASMQLASLRKQIPDLPPEANKALDEANHALGRAVRPLRSYLERRPTKKNSGGPSLFTPVVRDFPYREQ